MFRWPNAKFGPIACLVCLVAALHALLTAAVLIGAQTPVLGEGVVGRSLGVDARSLPGAWLRYDTGYYLSIAHNGYSATGSDLGFMPLYPLLVRMIAISSDPSVLAWVGLLVSNAALCGALAVLWHEVRRDHGERVAWRTSIWLAVFPTALFFAAFYTESLFLLWSVLTYWAARRQKYFAASSFVALASLTRVNGVALIVMPLVEIGVSRTPQWRRAAALTVIVSGTGLAVYAIYMAATHANPFAFIAAQETTMLRTTALPTSTVKDTLGVILGLDGFVDNWFMRFVSVYDLAATLLAVMCTVLGLRLLPVSLTAYMAVALILLTVSHGPYTLGLYSMSRYVLVLFPVFIALARATQDRTRLSWFISVSWIGMLLVAATWFGAGRWVA